MKIFTICLLHCMFIIPAVHSQQRVITGKCYIENQPDSYALVKLGKQSSINKDNTFLFIDSLFQREILFSFLGTVPLKIENIPTAKDIDLGKIELIPFSDRRISKEEYNKKRDNLLKRKKDTLYVDALLKSKYMKTVAIQIYDTYRKEYLDSLSEKERTKLMKKRKENSRQTVTECYQSNKPSKNKMSIYANAKQVVIPLEKHMKKDTICLNYSKVYGHVDNK